MEDSSGKNMLMKINSENSTNIQIAMAIKSGSNFGFHNSVVSKINMQCLTLSEMVELPFSE